MSSLDAPRALGHPAPVVSDRATSFRVGHVHRCQVQPELPSLSSFLFLMVAMHLVDDFYFYWNHRMLHTPWMWKHVHAFHHEIKEPTALSTSYIHPFEMILVSVGTPDAAQPSALGLLARRDPHVAWARCRRVPAQAL